MTKKIRKEKPPYWRVVQLLRKLRLKYYEIDAGEKSFHITIPDFGIVLRFNKDVPLLPYIGWDIVDVDISRLEVYPAELGESLMWLLISKGYMAYLRGHETGQQQLYRYFLITAGWGLKIIDKRLELYADQPKHRFMIQHNKRLRAYSISYIVTNYPDFFDYLW